MMTYEEAVAFTEQLPKFAPADMLPGAEPEKLTRMRELLSRLGDPQKDLRFVHVAGTNGKGSVCAFLEQILRESGKKTGLYTSPALERFTERIRMGGEEIPRDICAGVLDEVKQAREAMAAKGSDLPSEYEVVLAAALVYFARNACDVVILEVGLGGKRDATNVIDVPDAAVVTAISLDHTQILGSTTAQIAGEKAGIIKPDGRVLVYPQEEAVMQVFEHACREKGAQMIRAYLPDHAQRYDRQAQYFSLSMGDTVWEDLSISLLGTYQVNNAAMAVQTALLLKEKFPDVYGCINEETIRRGLRQTRWPGRFERVYDQPDVIVDGGHNEQGAAVLAESLKRYYPGKKICFITGVLEDKDEQAMFSYIKELGGRIYTITPPSPRAMQAGRLAEVLRSMGMDARPAENVSEALEAAVNGIHAEVICIFGSLYTLGEVREALHRVLGK